MTIGTYNELLQAAVRWSARPDFEQRVGDAIPLAEAKINRRLRVLDMETTNGTFTISAEYVALPANFGGVRNFELNGSTKVNLEHRPSDQMAIDYPTDTGKPRFYNIQDAQFRFAPEPDATYTATLVYFLKVPALTSSATTNWLLTSHPDAYLYGVLAELFSYVGDEVIAERWQARMYGVLDEIKAQSNRDRLGTGLTMRLA